MAVSNELNQAIANMETESKQSNRKTYGTCDTEIAVANMKIQALNILKRIKQIEDGGGCTCIKQTPSN